MSFIDELDKIMCSGHSEGDTVAFIENLIRAEKIRQKGVIIPCLDKGYVRSKPSWVMGAGDIDIVNDARVSYDVEVENLSDKDLKLIRYLGSHKHTSCFRGVAVKFELYAPLMIARQLWKYIIGSQHDESEEKWQDQFTNWNEVSHRYTKEANVFHVPNEWRSAPANSKQGSGDPVSPSLAAISSIKLREYQELGISLYERAISEGICVEQARLYLPAYGLYTRWRWTASLQTICHAIDQRVASGAQRECLPYMIAMFQITKAYFKAGLYELLDKESLEILKNAGVEV